jgi:hypothetical protein
MKAQFSESQLYQLNHQIEAFKQLAMFQNIPQDSMLEDRISILHPQIWKLRREKLLLESQKIYEEKI